MKHLQLSRDARGVGAVEFALALPVLLLFVLGAHQLGQAFYADSDLKNAVAAGATLASRYPQPPDEAIIEAITENIIRLDSGKLRGPTVSHGIEPGGYHFVDIEASYPIEFDLIFTAVAPISVTETRRVYTQPR